MDEDDAPTQTNEENDGDGDGYGYFADEIMVEILLRLPIKSLFRTKSVCKRCHNLSSHPSFIKLYNQISLKNPMLLLHHQSSLNLILIDHKAGVSELSLDFIKQDRLKIRASSNGCLLLCSSDDDDDDVYYVCNPVTRRFKLLPSSRQRPVTPFYPDGEPTLVALSCDFFTNAFYVVFAGYHRMFGQRPQGGKLICSVFHSQTNKWCRYVSDQHHHYGFTHMNKNQVVFLNDCLHWMTQNYVYILVFDLNCHVWTRMLLPDQITGSGTRCYLLELHGKLSVIQISSVWMHIWVYDDKGRWDMIDRVSLRCVRGMVPGIYPISQGTDYVFLAGHKQVLVYHRKTRVWKEMYSVNNHSTMPLWFSAHPFRGTIFSCR